MNNQFRDEAEEQEEELLEPVLKSKRPKKRKGSGPD